MSIEDKSLEVIGKTFGDIKVLELISFDNRTIHNSTFKCVCVICGSIFLRKYQSLKRNPQHNRFCHNGLYNNILWKDNYSARYHNILRRCKVSKHYKNIKCVMTYCEFMDELIQIQSKNNLSDEDMLLLSIDRIDNNLHYQVGNIRLASKLTQIYNRRNKPNCFIIENDKHSFISNSVNLTSKELNLNISAINNCIAGRAKTHKGYFITKITETEYYNIKSVTTKFNIIHKDYY